MELRIRCAQYTFTAPGNDEHMRPVRSEQYHRMFAIDLAGNQMNALGSNQVLFYATGYLPIQIIGPGTGGIHHRTGQGGMQPTGGAIPYCYAIQAIRFAAHFFNRTVIAGVCAALPGGENKLGAQSQNAWQLKNGETYYPEEIDYVIQREDIHTIEDLYFRRAGLGTIGPVPEGLNKLIVHRMGLLCGWTRKQMQWARQSIRNRYQLAPARWISLDRP